VARRHEHQSSVEDVEHNDDNKRHYQRDTNVSTQAARNMSNAWIEDRLKRAEAYGRKGRQYEPVMVLGQATHALMDKPAAYLTNDRPLMAAWNRVGAAMQSGGLAMRVASPG
jgi:hypothetical protein